jgi:hypothetical protein
MFGIGGSSGGAGELLGWDQMDKGAAAQRDYMMRALGMSERMFDVSRGDLMPYMDAGKNTLPQLLGMVTPGSGYDFSKSPDYAFRAGEGEKAINRAAGVGGSPYSGATLKALTGFNSNLASGEFGKAFDRLMGITTLGANAAGASAGVAGNTGNTLASLLAGQGASEAGLGVAKANSIGALLGAGITGGAMAYGRR